MPLFGRREPSPPPAPVDSPERKTGFFSRRRSSSSDMHRSSTSSHHTGTSSTKRHSSVLHRGSGDPSIHAATQSLRQAEAAEREADAALFRAKNAVREAREHVRRLEKEAAEEARLAKIKQSEAKALGKKGRALGPVRNQAPEPRKREIRATRRQTRREDAMREATYSDPSAQPEEPPAARATRQRPKRKAPEQDLAEARSTKRSTLDVHENCTDGRCVAFAEQTVTSSIEYQEAREEFVIDVDQSTPASDALLSPVTSGFLALPRELRDEIYKHVLNSGDKRAVTLQNRDFITKSGLIGVNSQIKEEFLDAVLFFAPVVHTTVRNHNFAHVVTFLNRLSEAQLHKFAAAATPNSDPEAKMRSRKIIITLTYSRTKMSTKPQLNRWLDRFDDPKRRGAEVRIEYKLDRDSWQNGGYKQRASGRASAGPRSQEEVNKILKATREGSRGYWF
ncbi:hypothetical protein E8E12_001993 [Didymella heteroderae]|uniref:Uncharacterized protein n=1 Tax=Didymella heteroderae TaxID=1769908 RepID=A0A9P4WR90_9PLEO|nr:hypothetical protein E8E12_001993 [Didymella heteroderae]